ncbi:MAG: two-component system response regulator [Proteobacteria bacterium]|nr:two-component system response regulator [Pseudomonadota bacterium]
MSDQKSKILIVDDAPANIKVLGQILMEDYEIKVAPSGFKALEIAQSLDPPDLILLDIMMPKMNGFEVCERLKANARTANIPVIFVTTKSEEGDEAKGFDLGAVDYIPKPVSPPIVRARVKTHLALKKAQEELKNQNLFLDEEVRKRTNELLQSQIEILERLGMASEYRDEDTGHHIHRMSTYCKLLGESVGLTPEINKNFTLASTMHDLGKIGIPDTILHKPAKLTKEEFEIMKTHTTIGAGLLAGSNSRILQTAEIIALTHHERWDGTGYPNSLSGEDIPLVGRISGIADVFDALISNRPYKKGWPFEKAIEEIERNSGSHFDPRLVEKFLKLKPELLKIVLHIT